MSHSFLLLFLDGLSLEQNRVILPQISNRVTVITKNFGECTLRGNRTEDYSDKLFHTTTGKVYFCRMTEPTGIEWFEEWFNSPYYHLLYGNRDEGEAAAFIDKLLEKIGLEPEARVLDLACGKGRHSRQINSNGFEVVGIDLSENSIKEAKQLENDGLEFFVHDMRQLFWKHHFNLVVNLFTSFGYFHDREDDLKMMSGVYDSLKPSGLFVIDFMNASKVVRNLVDQEEKTIDEVRFVINRVVEGGIIKKTIKVIDGDFEQVFVEEVDELYLSDFEELLSQVGFTVQNTFGDYGLGDFDEGESDRLIIVAAKHGNG